MPSSGGEGGGGLFPAMPDCCFVSQEGLTEMDSHVLELGPCCTIKAPSKLEQCNVRMAEGLLIASDAHIALHSLTRLSI